MSNTSRRAVSMARAAICSGVWPAMIGRLGTPACSASWASCNWAAGRWVSRLASSTFLRSRWREAQRQLARGGGLAGALQADHQDGDRRGGVQVERHRAGAAELLDHHVVDDLHHLLAGGDAVQHLLADGALADLGDEVLDHGQRHVGIQQREADLAQGVVHVGLAQRAAAAQAVEDAGEFSRKAFEHANPNTLRAGARTFADRRIRRRRLWRRTGGESRKEGQGSALDPPRAERPLEPITFLTVVERRG